MTCPYCLGTSFSKGKFDLAQVVNMQPVLIRNVPASKCSQCGYLQVNATTMKKIERMLRDHSPDATVPTEVYDMQSPARHSRVDYTPAPTRVSVFGSRVTV